MEAQGRNADAGTPQARLGMQRGSALSALRASLPRQAGEPSQASNLSFQARKETQNMSQKPEIEPEARRADEGNGEIGAPDAALITPEFRQYLGTLRRTFEATKRAALWVNAVVNAAPLFCGRCRSLMRPTKRAPSDRASRVYCASCDRR